MGNINAVDNPNPTSTESAASHRWAWLKTLPGKFLRRDPSIEVSTPDSPEEHDNEQPIITKPIPLDGITIPQDVIEVVEEVADNPQQAEDGSDVDEEIPVTARDRGIGIKIQQDLANSAMQIPEIETMGVTAVIGTNETVGEGFFEAVQSKHPNGYLVGVGSGNAYSMIHVFENGVIPRGVVLADIDPKAVAMGRLLIQNLKESGTAADFQINFFGIPEEAFNHQLQKMIADEPNMALRRRWESVDVETWHRVWEELSKKRELVEWQDIRDYKHEGENIDVVGAILDRFDILKQLADEDNIVMAYADFTYPDFIEAVKRLPGFDSSTNVIYLSNIIDHITKRGFRIENARDMNFLKAYENPEHPAVFIDTLGQGLNYFLRARNSLAEFTPDDFRNRGRQPRSQKPEGLLFPDNPSLNP